MAKELPYFRFTASEWQNGDISLEDYSLKGFFIDLCSYYWIKDCSVTIAMLEKRFRGDNEYFKDLINLGIIKNEKENGFISISFLDEQFDMLSEQRKRRQEAGSKGGKQKSSNAKAELKQNSSYKDKDKYKDKYKDKPKTFSDEIRNFTGTLSSFFPDNIRNKLTEKEKLSLIDTIDKLKRIDKYTEDQILKAVKNGRNDEFWSKQFLSLSKLRKKNGDGVKYIDIFLELNKETSKQVTSVKANVIKPGDKIR